MLELQDYSHYPWKLDDIKELCKQNIGEILAFSAAYPTCHCGDGLDDICVRYVFDENKFGYAWAGDFFFIDDCMYVISDDEMFKECNNPDMREIASEIFGKEYTREEKYVARVIFAGVRTPFKDDLGDWIYTGDVISANDGDIISGVCAFPPFMEEDIRIDEPALYGLMLDNCMQRLIDCRNMKRLGTIFFCLDRESTTEISLEQDIGGRAQHGVFDEQYLYCCKYTPSFYQEYWKYEGLEMLGVEYNWRK